MRKKEAAADSLSLGCRNLVSFRDPPACSFSLMNIIKIDALAFLLLQVTVLKEVVGARGMLLRKEASGNEVNRLKLSVQMKMRTWAQMPSKKLALRGRYTTLCT